MKIHSLHVEYDDLNSLRCTKDNTLTSYAINQFRLVHAFCRTQWDESKCADYDLSCHIMSNYIMLYI